MRLSGQYFRPSHHTGGAIRFIHDGHWPVHLHWDRPFVPLKIAWSLCFDLMLYGLSIPTFWQFVPHAMDELSARLCLLNLFRRVTVCPRT